MTYSYSLSIPANTLGSSPHETVVKVSGGMMTKVGINIPPGHAGLTGIAIFKATVQIYPFSRGNWISGNNVVIEDSVDFYINENDTELIIKCYNEDELIDHGFDVRITIDEMSIKSLLVRIEQRLQNIEQSAQHKNYKPGLISGLFNK